MRKTLAAIVLLALSGDAGCRYNNVLSRGPEGITPYVNLNCSEPGNDIGFSFELPGCVCENGIRIRYVGKRMPDGSYDIYYEQERGYLSGNPWDLILMRSRSPDILEEIYVGGRKIPPEEADLWKTATENWTSILRLYGRNVMRDAFRICQEDEEKK